MYRGLRDAIHALASTVNCFRIYAHARVKSRAHFHVPTVLETGTCRSSSRFARCTSMDESVMIIYILR